MVKGSKQVLANVIAVGICFFFLGANESLAQTTAPLKLDVVSPLKPIIAREGADFATEQLQNPWDFKQVEDAALWMNAENVSTDSLDVLRLVNRPNAENIDAMLFFLTKLPSLKGLSRDLTVPASGLEKPIDASRYRYLVFRSNLAQRSQYRVAWLSQSSTADMEDVESFLVGEDLAPSRVFPSSIWTVNAIDLTQVPSSVNTGSGAWSGLVTQLSLEASTEYQAGVEQQIDWVRLVDPGDATEWQTIEFSISDIRGLNRLAVYYDTDSTGYDGTLFAAISTGISAGGNSISMDLRASVAPSVIRVQFSDTGVSLSFPKALLPPGKYQFYLQAVDTSGNLQSSPYTPVLTLDAKPRVSFSSPSEVSGVDYATSELGNPWDMSSVMDVWNLQNLRLRSESRNFTCATADLASCIVPLKSGSELMGRINKAGATSGGTAGSSISEASFDLKVDANRPVFTDKYRYLSVTLSMADEISDLALREGRGLGLALNFNHLSGDEGGMVGGRVYLPGKRTYVFDLWNSEQTWLKGQRSWLDYRSLLNLSLSLQDNAEGANQAATFSIDDVKLTAENRPVNNVFQVDFEINDDLAKECLVSLYYSTDKLMVNRKKIGENRFSVGKNSYLWNTSGVAAGTYYVSALTSDNLTLARAEDDPAATFTNSPATVSVGSGNVSRGKVASDFDGDAQSDRTVYRSSAGLTYQWRSREGLLAVPWVAGNEFYPIAGDFDGDKIADLAVVFNYYDNLGWYIHESSTNNVRAVLWGYLTDQVAVADYDGDGRDEVAVYRDGAWYVLDETGIGYGQYWGTVGDVPVPADYDGDGKADLAVFRVESDGYGWWWILNSGFSAQKATSPYGLLQWGLASDIPFARDIEGDGLADFTVWRPSTGTWYTYTAQGNINPGVQWGLPGDVPMVGDYNGDGYLDLTVYRPDSGLWFHRYQNDQWTWFHWGLAGDRVILPGLTPQSVLP